MIMVMNLFRRRWNDNFEDIFKYIHQDKTGVVISKEDLTEKKIDDELNGKTKGEWWNDLSNMDKYGACLKMHGLIKEKTSEGKSEVGSKVEYKIDWNAAKIKGDIVTSLESGSFFYEDKGKDKNIKIYFAGAEEDGNNVEFSQKPKTKPSEMKCRTYENFGGGKKSVFLKKSETQRVYDRIRDLCKNRRSIDNVSKELANLDHSYGGNFKELEAILNNTLIQLFDKQREKITDELENIVESDDDEKKLSKRQVKEFARLSDQLSEDVLRPVAKHIESLRKKLSRAKTDQEKEKIQNEIDKFAALLGGPDPRS